MAAVSVPPLTRARMSRQMMSVRTPVTARYDSGLPDHRAGILKEAHKLHKRVGGHDAFVDGMDDEGRQSCCHLGRVEGSDGTVFTNFRVEAEEELQARQHLVRIGAEWVLDIPAHEGRS